MVKGLGIIYVFFRHLSELTGVHVYGPAVYSLFNCGTEALMFLFVLLSGYVYKSKGSIGADIRNKFKQLMIPYLIYVSFFNVTYFIRYILLGDMSFGLFLRNMISNYLAKPNLDIPVLGSGANIMRYAVVPFWYIAEIFMAFLLFIVVSDCLKDKGVKAKAAAAAALLAASSLLMHLDLRGLLAGTFASRTSYFFVVINIVGFSGLLMIGTILHQYKIFDIDAHSKRFTGILFAVCMIRLLIQAVRYSNSYALQYGKWGQYGIWSVAVVTLTGFALTYSLIYISYYLKRIRPLKAALSFLGANTMDILLLHLGIGELLCMIFGFWVPIFDVPYPEELFAWWHFGLVSVLTAGIVIGYLLVKKQRKKRSAGVN